MILGRLIVNIAVKDVQCDELRGFVGKKEKTVELDEASLTARSRGLDRRTRLQADPIMGGQKSQVEQICGASEGGRLVGGFLSAGQHASAVRPGSQSTANCSHLCARCCSMRSDRAPL